MALRFDRKWIAVSIMCGLGFVLYYHAFSKAVDPRNALTSLSYVFGSTVSRGLVRFLVMAEIGLGSVLVAGAYPRLALLMAAALFLLFGFWIGYLLVVKAPVTCGCDGSSVDVSARTKFWMLGRAFLLLALSVAGWRLTTLSDSVKVT